MAKPGMKIVYVRHYMRKQQCKTNPSVKRFKLLSFHKKVDVVWRFGTHWPKDALIVAREAERIARAEYRRLDSY